MKQLFLLRTLFIVVALWLLQANAMSEPPVNERITLPPGFEIEWFAKDVPGARSLARGPLGTIFVGSRQDGHVYALRDVNGDGRSDTTYVLASNLYMPNGVAVREGALYVAEVNRVIRFDSVESRLSNPLPPVVINATFPTDGHHGWKFIAFGPDGWLYVPVGAPCNVCEKDDERYSSIMRMKPDGSSLEVYAHGVRNSVGFDWHPHTNELWFTDNGRDMMGDDVPSDELNRAPHPGLHFGFPYCHAGDVPDPSFGEGAICEAYVPPTQKLGAHVASLGMRFYRGSMFPEIYRDQIFIAEHGSWNRSTPVGYRITRVRLDAARAIEYEVFASGWRGADGVITGRPVDLLELPDGSLLVSDDYGNGVYRITYTKDGNE